MALIVEDGSGRYGADAYASVDDVTAYWGNRPHSALSAQWTDASSTHREGAIREATAYLDATYYLRYRGVAKMGENQGLQWPRADANDDEFYDLPPIPKELVNATSELAVRALAEQLSPDADQHQHVKRVLEKVGSIQTETEYIGGDSLEQKFGFVENMLAPILKVTRGWEWC